MKGARTEWKRTERERSSERTAAFGKVTISPHSAQVRALDRLVRSREERERTGLFYAEGMRFVSQAMAQGAKIESVIVAPDLLKHPFGLRVWETLREQDLPILSVSAPIFASLSRVDEPQGIAVVAHQRWERLERIRPTDGLCWIALDTVRSTGNLGTILRTSEAVGGRGLMLVGSRIDPYDPGVVRATMGAHFGQKFVRTELAALRGWTKRNGVTLVGTSPHATEDYHAARYDFPVVLWLGGEREGMPDEHLAVCDRVVRIPMVGKSDSLNVAIAAGVMLYEFFNQSRQESVQK